MNDLIKQCRYYKEEVECPESIKEKGMSTIWYYEQIWVEREELRDEGHFNIIEYIRAGLKDFNTDDGTPLTLKSLLYNRYTHWSGGYGIESDTRNFKDWYLNNYIKFQD
ncbi:MAG TPA: hypothetical protein VFC67_20035 [Prolixibacteraceae bacterium]|nr:hypothetical protein [Prolixibacteraceae bacterium]